MDNIVQRPNRSLNFDNAVYAVFGGHGVEEERMKNDFDDLIRLGRDTDALWYLANEYYKNGKMGDTRKLLLERAADTLETLHKELASLAIESVKRDIALAKLEAEVTAVIDRQGKWVKTTLDSGWVECVCSICGGDAPAEYGRYTWLKTDYCPHCGGRMEEVE